MTKYYIYNYIYIFIPVWFRGSSSCDAERNLDQIYLKYFRKNKHFVKQFLMWFIYLNADRQLQTVNCWIAMLLTP